MFNILLEMLVFAKKIIGATASIKRKNPHCRKIPINFLSFNEAENISPLRSACTAEAKNLK